MDFTEPRNKLAQATIFDDEKINKEINNEINNSEINNAPSVTEAPPEPKPKPKPKRPLIRMNTVSSSSPLHFQEFATEMLDNERRKLNQSLITNNGPDPNAKPTKNGKLHDERVMKEIPPPVKSPLSYSDLFGTSGKPDYKLLKEHLIQEGKLEKEAALALIEQATGFFRDEPNLLELEAPFTVCGDIHGQFYDLVNLIDNAGDPATTPYLFLGDYVDRGSFSCEVCFLLLCMKINSPDGIFMIRGNHESRAMTNIHNFKAEVLKKYDEELYNKFMDCFDCLPLAAVLNCKLIGRFFCVHGGLSPNIETLEDIQVLNRYLEVPSDGPICDMLWSDPVLEDDEMAEREIIEFREIDFLDNVERGIGFFFGYRAVTQFLLKNNLISIVRAHEVQQDGCAEHTFTRPDLTVPMAFTVFSAPNYCDYYANKAAYIKFMNNKYEIYQLESVPHPYWLPDFQNVFSFSIDYVLESVRTIVKGLAKAVTQDEEEGVEWTQESKSEYMKKLNTMQSKMKISDMPLEEGFSNLPPEQRFRIAKQKDGKFEKSGPVKNKALKSLRRLQRHASSPLFY